MNDLERQKGRTGPVRADVGPNAVARNHRWGWLAAIALVGTTAAWATGREATKCIQNHDIEIASRRQPPAPGFPAPSRRADNNNMIMRMGLVGDLDGTAVAYTIEADHLVADGKFQIDLPLEQMAELLAISPDLLANPRSPDAIDPGAALFRAQAGTLTDSAKERSRKMRRRQVLDGKKPDAVVGEWVITEFTFTLDRLKQPNEQEKRVLSAISAAAAETMPRPGDKIRAVGVNGGDLELGRIALTKGMLPLEAISQCPDNALAYP